MPHPIGAANNKNLPNTKKTAIREDSGVGRVFMVAGAGFELRSTLKQNRQLVAILIDHPSEARPPLSIGSPLDPIRFRSNNRPK